MQTNPEKEKTFAEVIELLRLSNDRRERVLNEFTEASTEYLSKKESL